MDESGNLLISDTNNNRVQQFTKDGAFLRAFGSLGSEPGQMSNPHGLTFDFHGRLAVVDRGNKRVQVFDYPSCEFLFSFGESLLDHPAGITMDLDGNFIIADSWHHKIQVFSDKGVHIRGFGVEGHNNSSPGSLFYPVGVAVDEKGYIYVVENGNDRLQIFDPNGKSIRIVGRKGSNQGQFNCPWGLAVDTNQNVIIADQFNNRIQIVSFDGEFQKEIGPLYLVPPEIIASHKIQSPTSLVFDGRGDLIITDRVSNRILIFG